MKNVITYKKSVAYIQVIYIQAINKDDIHMIQRNTTQISSADSIVCKQ